MKTSSPCPFNPITKPPRRNLSIHTLTNKENANRTLSPSFYNESYSSNKTLQKKRTGLKDKASNSLNMSKKDITVAVLDLGEALGKMEEYQQFCAKEFKLKEGQEAKEKVIELKQEIIQKTKQQIEEKYRQEAEVIMESQSKEMNAFNEFWDEAVKKFEEQARFMQTEMFLRQKQDIIVKEDEFRRGVAMKKKVSPQYLSYKKSFETLVKQKQFREAEKIKGLCEEIEREEMNKAFNEKEQKVKNLMNQVEQKHKNEQHVLNKKISTGREELMKARVSELEQLLLRFQNTRSQLEQEQQLELAKFEMTNKTYRIGFEEISARSSYKASNRTSRRPSKSTLRIRDSSAKLQSLNMSMLSPTNEFRPFDHVTMSAKNSTSRHRRTNTSSISNTSDIKSFKISEISGVVSPTNNFMLKRSNSVIRR